MVNFPTKVDSYGNPTEFLRWRQGKESGNLHTVVNIDVDVKPDHYYTDKTRRPLLYTWRPTGLNLFILDFDRKDYTALGHTDAEVWEYAAKVADHYGAILFSSCSHAPKVAVLVEHEMSWEGYNVEELLKDFLDETTLSLIDHKPAAFYSIFLGAEGASTLSRQLADHLSGKQKKTVWTFKSFEKKEPDQVHQVDASICKQHKNWAKFLINEDNEWFNQLVTNPILSAAYNLEDVPCPKDWKKFLRFLCGKISLYPALLPEGETPGVLAVQYISDNLEISKLNVSFYIRLCVELGLLDKLTDASHVEGRAATYEGNPALEKVCKHYFRSKPKGIPYQQVDEGDTLKARRALAFIANSEEQIKEWANTTHRWLLQKGRLENTIKHFHLYRSKTPHPGIEKKSPDLK